MKYFCMVLLATLTFSVTAQDEGETKTIDGQKLTYNKGVWVHDDLGSDYKVTEEFNAVYRSKKWRTWYDAGSPTLKKILDLGPNVVFNFKGSDGNVHVYSVFANKKLAKRAVAGGAAAIATGLGGAAAGAGAAAAGAGAAAAGAGAAAATTGTILGVSAGTAAAIGGAVVAGAVIVENNDDSSEASTAKR